MENRKIPTLKSIAAFAIFFYIKIMEFRISISLHGFLSSRHLIFLIIVAVVMSLSEDVSAASHLRNGTDRLALIQFKHQISDDPHRVLNSWNDSLHHYQWQGVTCSARHQRVIAITLPGMDMFGSISPHLGNLSFLRSIELGNNRFHGKIPQEVGRLFRLRFLNLTTNTLTGIIPANLSRCLDLRVIDLYQNKLEGKIPVELRSLKKLIVLKFSSNNLTGAIPSFLGNLTSIKKLYLAFNNLDGGLPQEIGLLENLSVLNVGDNKLTGTFPASIFFNISSIAAISIAENFFYGKLPVGIGIKQPNLWYLGISGNQFTGIIPQSITNASRLEELFLGRNIFEGQVPSNLGDLLNLRWFLINKNHLGGNSTGDLRFIASLSNCSNLQVLGFDGNNFGGELPKSITNLSLQLNDLYMGGNNILGKLPRGLGRFINLNLLAMEENYFSGVIPNDFGEFQQLQLLSLGRNQLSGKIPSILCNITSLYYLDLDANAFIGEITECFGNCQNLRKLYISRNNLSVVIPPVLFTKHFLPLELDLSYNSLTGLVPLEVGKLMGINNLNLSYNKFSGEIPSTLGDCSSLEYLHLQGNYFRGSIPSKLASLKGIQELDLSQNNLTGQIPKEFENLRVLKYLNLSFNDLEGEIPIHGLFKNASRIFLLGNSKLCGGIPELRFPSCIIHNKKKKKPLVIIITCAVLGGILIFVILPLIFIVYSKRHKRNESSNKSWELTTIRRISYHELHRATGGFSQENLVGRGSFGSVYRGRIDQNTNRVVAIKVLNFQKHGASKSFKAECRALRNIRHRNIVPILTYCSSIDFKGHEFKAIVYKYMENGSLDEWLHQEIDEQSTNLSLVQRLKIAMDVAFALHYIHSQNGSSIVHCDLKPSNILLDNDLNAHVADFGLARLLGETVTNPSEQETSSSVAIKGSIGYAAPEYGIGGDASPEGDIYSFGILLLEMFSGRRPTDDIFVDGLNLHNYIEMNLPKNVKKIIDPLLLYGEGKKDVEKCIASLFRIGLRCSESSPNDRMDMNEAIRELQSIKGAFLV